MGYFVPTEDGRSIYVIVDHEDRHIHVKYSEPEFKVREGDYIEIQGYITDTRSPQVTATKCKTISYEEYIDRSNYVVDTIDVNQSQNQSGYTIKVEKVILFENETEVSLRIENNGSKNLIVVPVLKQGEQDILFIDSDTDNMPTNIGVGEYSEGILSFESKVTHNCSLTFDVVTEDGSNVDKLEKFVFEITSDKLKNLLT